MIIKGTKFLGTHQVPHISIEISKPLVDYSILT